MIDKDGFEAWVVFVEGTIQQLLNELPQDISQRLNFTPESLDVLEGWLLNKYESPTAILHPSENWYIDRASKYVGETIRHNAGGEWTINLDDPNYAYYGLPEIRSESFTAECPSTLVTSCLDRRRGNYIRSIVENIMNESR